VPQLRPNQLQVSRHSLHLLGTTPQRSTVRDGTLQPSSVFYRSPEACSGARCSVAPPANERQMQDLGALALPWSRRLGRLDVHPCRDDPSSPKSHLQSPGCSLFDSRGCSGTVRAAFSLSLSRWVCFCLSFSAPLLVNWDLNLATIVTVLSVTVREPRGIIR
jgi:hypothetical protein